MDEEIADATRDNILSVGDTIVLEFAPARNSSFKPASQQTPRCMWSYPLSFECKQSCDTGLWFNIYAAWYSFSTPFFCIFRVRWSFINNQPCCHEYLFTSQWCIYLLSRCVASITWSLVLQPSVLKAISPRGWNDDPITLSTPASREKLLKILNSSLVRRFREYFAVGNLIDIHEQHACLLECCFIWGNYAIYALEILLGCISLVVLLPLFFHR